MGNPVMWVIAMPEEIVVFWCVVMAIITIAVFVRE